MRGVVLVKFSEFIEEVWGDEFLDQIIVQADLPSEGAYSATMTYNDQELFDLVAQVVQEKQITVKEAQFAFGKWLFKELLAMAPKEAHTFTSTFEFLHAVQNFIHVEVKKLNPDSVLPEFTFLEQSENKLLLHYQSPRNLCFFCEGLIAGLSEHTGESVSTRQTECVHCQDSRCVIEVTLHS